MNRMKKIKDIIINILNNKNKRTTLITYIVIPILLNLFVESLSRKSILKGFAYPINEPIPFFVNTLIILMTLMISIFFKRRFFAIVIVSFFWLLLGFANFVLLSNRVTPFNATDILLMQPAIAVITKYYSSFTIAMVIGGIGLLLCFIGYLWFKAPKLNYKIRYIRNAVVAGAVVFITMLSLTISTNAGFLNLNFENLANAYKKYGFVYCFSNSVFNTGVSKPKNYSMEKIAEIVSETESPEAVEAMAIPSAKTPNIIFLQLESFFDIRRYTDLVLSENPTPVFTQLMEDYPSGLFSVPSVGAGTANTEFEVLTGMNLDDFGPGEYPYKTVLQSKTSESISHNLKPYGYKAHAIHNNDGTFYQRHTVFSQLGFDTFISQEYMSNLEYTFKNWPKDKVLTGEILKALDSTEEKDFIFAVSVEGHGSYPGKQILENPEVTVEEISNQAKKYSFEYYVNLMRSMDNFVGDLIKELSEHDEEIILVLYGDHLPSLGISDDSLSLGTTMETEYIIWNNMNLEIENEDIEAFQLSSKILQLIGVETGLINKFHQTHKYDEEYLNGLQNLEYDLLYGNCKGYGGINPYLPSDIQMGIDKISITQILPDVENQENTYIIGENFTEYSMVYVNGSPIETEFIDINHLRINYPELAIEDVFKVGQQGSDKVVLSFTEDYIYY